MYIAKDIVQKIKEIEVELSDIRCLNRNYCNWIKYNIISTRDREETLNSELKKFKQSLAEIQTKCIHEWEYDGHGHCWNYYKCKKCTKMEER